MDGSLGTVDCFWVVPDRSYARLMLLENGDEWLAFPRSHLGHGQFWGRFQKLFDVSSLHLVKLQDGRDTPTARGSEASPNVPHGYCTPCHSAGSAAEPQPRTLDVLRGHVSDPAPCCEATGSNTHGVTATAAPLMADQLWIAA